MLSVVVLVWSAVAVWRHARLQRVLTVLGLLLPLPAVVITVLLFFPQLYSA
jgi:hypothetical protein